MPQATHRLVLPADIARPVDDTGTVIADPPMWLPPAPPAPVMIPREGLEKMLQVMSQTAEDARIARRKSGQVAAAAEQFAKSLLSGKL